MATPKYVEDFQKEMKIRHPERLSQQRTDQEFLENSYPLILIKKKDYQMRTNFAARMINAVTQQLISNLPKIYVKSNSDTEVAKNATNGISKVLNRWVYSLLRQVNNPFEQTFKNYNYRGEAWLYIPHNSDMIKDEDWEEKYPDALPVLFIPYDPMVIFSEPNEEIDGEPERVLIQYEQNVSYVQKAYPLWSNPAGKEPNKKAKFVFYFDRERSYAQADTEPLFRNRKGKLLNDSGERTNPYGCVPFVHLYSGWGFEDFKRSPDLLAYSRIRMIRDLITEDSQVRSDQLYNFHDFAHKSKTLYVTGGAEVSAGWADAYKNEPDKLNLIMLPEGSTPDYFKVDESQLFDAAAFAYADRIRMDLGSEYPAPLQGAGGTSSGREANILSGNALALYDCAVENTSLLWSKGLWKALKVAESIDLLPKEISKEDLKRISEIIVDLRSDDPIARDRAVNQGSVLVNEGKRSLKTFLMQDMRMTEAEADDEIDNILAEKIMLQSPEIAAFLGFKAAQKSGMAEELQAYRDMMAQQGVKKPPIEVGSAIGSKGGQPRKGNIKTETGRQMVDVSNSGYGARTPPQRY